MPFTGVMPAIKPEIASFGLLSVADVTEHPERDSHWVNGFDFETEACNFNASIMKICAPGEPDLELFDSSDTPSYYPVKPFAIKVEDVCLTPGWDVHDRKAMVLRKLKLVTQKALEMELWSGFATSVSNPDEGRWLASDTVTKIASSGTMSLNLAFALLEKALGDSGVGGQGVIHVPRDVATLLDTHVQPEGDVLKSKNNGNLVVSGVGYSGSAPGELDRSDTDPTKVWIYATGPIVVHLGAPELLTPAMDAAINLRNNEVTWVAARPAGVYWDGCSHFGVEVDLTTGGTSVGNASFGSGPN